MSALLLVQMGWRRWLRPKAQMGFLSFSPDLTLPTHSQQSSWTIEVLLRRGWACPGVHCLEEVGAENTRCL